MLKSVPTPYSADSTSLVGQRETCSAYFVPNELEITTIELEHSEFTAVPVLPSEVTETRRVVVEDHVKFPLANVNIVKDHAYRTRARREGAVRAIKAFGLQSSEALSHDPRDTLDRFVRFFFQKFHPLCPIFREQSFDSYDVPPIIFLSIICIGARFAEPKAAHYGAMLHDRLQQLLVGMVLTPIMA
jgi:hypothetical protein